MTQEIELIKSKDGIIAATDEDKKAIDRLKVGSTLKCKSSQPRNLKFHRKFFALMKLAFEYYEPSGGVLTMDEKRIAKSIFETLERHSGGNGAILEFGRQYMKSLSESRKGKIPEIKKAFEPFRKEMIIASGYYDVITTPRGTKKVARSISFSSMSESEFNGLYKSVFSTLWRFVLSRHFHSEDEAECAANSMLEFS